jgi:hypothetical protein
LLDKEKETDIMHCMNCKKEWDEKSYLSKFPATFKQEWRKHSIEMGINKEKRLLQTYSHAHMIKMKKKELEEKMKKVVSFANEKKRKLRSAIDSLEKKKKEYISYVTREIEKLSDKKQELADKCDIDGCTGYSHQENPNEKWLVCIECNQRKCIDCYEKYTDEHECQKEMLETVKMVEDNTRKCPGCNIRILKTVGCDQMWCVRCKTTFSWRTGQTILTGQIHNPHYVEYMKSNRNLEREIDDIPCGGIPGKVYESLFTRLKLPSELQSEIDTVYHLAYEIQNRALVIMRYQIERDQEFRTKFAGDYLNKVITEEQWKIKLYNLKFKTKKNREMIYVVKTLLIVIIDYINSMVQTGKHHYNVLKSEKHVYIEIYKAFLSELNDYRVYFNEVSFEIHRKYSSRSFMYLNINWTFITKTCSSALSERVESNASISSSLSSMHLAQEESV